MSALESPNFSFNPNICWPLSESVPIWQQQSCQLQTKFPRQPQTNDLNKHLIRDAATHDAPAFGTKQKTSWQPHTDMPNQAGSGSDDDCISRQLQDTNHLRNYQHVLPSHGRMEQRTISHVLKDALENLSSKKRPYQAEEQAAYEEFVRRYSRPDGPKHYHHDQQLLAAGMLR